ncbi:MAG: alkane 1-monooxygenase [Gammaproteobacteria bacterium]
MKDLKYLAAYINPALAVIGLLLGGLYAWSTVLFSFFLIPILDQISPIDSSNHDVVTKETLINKRLFDWLLYLNIPIVYGVVGLFIYQINHVIMPTEVLLGQILSVGIVIGSCGINVAHELGHRKEKYHQLLGQILLIPALYMHFFIEHNRGHHRFVATDDDPASARKGEWLFIFWFRSVFGCFTKASKLEAIRLGKKQLSYFSRHNQFLQFMLIQSLYLVVVYSLSSWFGLAVIVLSAFVGVLLLETINYIEHYGLRRKVRDNGRYERVRPHHSWNANYTFGRIALYELTRHSDHHFIASKKFQVLDHHDEAPVLPFGYPAMILIALLPPVWFQLMDKRIPQH